MTLQEFKEIFRSILDTYQFRPKKVTFRKYGFGPEMDTTECLRCEKQIDGKKRCLCPITAVYHYKTGIWKDENEATAMGLELGLSPEDIQYIMIASDRMDRNPYKFFGIRK